MFDRTRKRSAIPNGSSELRRSADASLLDVEVLTNLANREEEKIAQAFFDSVDGGFIRIT